jgi:hypothetical protein
VRRDVGYPDPVIDAALISELSEPERNELERASSLYYIQTRRGVFRVSRITHEVVEV